MDYLLLILFIYVILALITMSMAKTRGRNQIIGIVMGLLFGVFAIIGYAIIGDTEDKKMERIRKVMNINS